MLNFFKEKRLFFLGILIALITCFLDLLTKRLIFAWFDSLGSEVIAVTSFFNLAKVWNLGVSFGMFDWLNNSWIILSIVQILIAVILMIWLYKNSKMHLVFALGLIIGGAFGNASDRIMNGAVADFLDFYVGNYHWPAFNLADSCIFIGVAILVFEDFFIKKR